MLQFLIEAGFIGWCIVGVGLASLALVAERAYALYFKYNINASEFMAKVHSFILAKKIDEALILSSQLVKKPLAQSFRTILEKADREDDAIFQAHDIAMSETVPLLTKRLHYLSMLANVATLMGLLGTIHGLILSFQAVATADPSQKQVLLAHGISVSMYTTALGLAVAIPAMIFYSFLVSQQNKLIEQMTEKCGRLTEILTGSHFQELNRKNVYPNDLAKSEIIKVQTPPPSAKVS